jgi:hypothetical protein
VNLVIDQAQQEEPYTLDLDVLVEEQGGSRRVHNVHLDARRGEFRLPVSGMVTAVTVDPDFRILRWDEVYAMNGR